MKWEKPSLPLSSSILLTCSFSVLSYSSYGHLSPISSFLYFFQKHLPHLPCLSYLCLFLTRRRMPVLYCVCPSSGPALTEWNWKVSFLTTEIQIKINVYLDNIQLHSFLYITPGIYHILFIFFSPKEIGKNKQEILKHYFSGKLLFNYFLNFNFIQSFLDGYSYRKNDQNDEWRYIWYGFLLRLHYLSPLGS